MRVVKEALIGAQLRHGIVDRGVHPGPVLRAAPDDTLRGQLQFENARLPCRRSQGAKNEVRSQRVAVTYWENDLPKRLVVISSKQKVGPLLKEFLEFLLTGLRLIQ